MCLDGFGGVGMAEDCTGQSAVFSFNATITSVADFQRALESPFVRNASCLKLLLKETVVPTNANTFGFVFAPVLTLFLSLFG